MIIYFSIIAFILMLNNLKYIYRYILSYNYLKKEHKPYIYNNKKKLTIIIPVYKEVNNIKKSIEFFKNLHERCNVIYITTSKEKNNLTHLAIEKEIKLQNCKNIFVDKCPNSSGNMATQITYIAKKLPSEAIIGLYNIDSFPQKNTFDYVLAHIKKGICFQQVSYFNDNLKGVMASAQDFQNRWSILFEMGKMLQKESIFNFKYTIGHGLFIIKSDLEKLGYWSDQFINEDNELGFRMTCLKFKIKPIPFLEKAGFAKNKTIYIKQQSVWFNDPFNAFQYYKTNLNNGIKANLVTVLVDFKQAVSWLLLPWIYNFNIILSAFFNYYFMIVFIVLFIIYIPILNFLSRSILYRLGYVKNIFSKKLLVSDILFFAMHSFGPILTIINIIRKKNTISNKYKTEK